jgi:hypothetical protein
MIDVRRQMVPWCGDWRELFAVNSSAQRAAEQGSSFGGSGGLSATMRKLISGVNSALQQW